MGRLRSIAIQDYVLWDKLKDKRVPLSFDLEVTARCNNNCRHCYINLPANDRTARAKELSPAEISRLADEAVALGAMWCLITGCLLYTSDAADDLLCVDLGGRRIIQ